jgi:hypothetical protein
VHCSDEEIKNIHLSTRFYGDKDRDARNIEILCNLINSMHYTKKYFSTNKLETAYQWCIEVLTNYARLLMSLDGHITDKDILSFAVTVNGSVEYLFNKLKDEDSIKDKINEILNTVENFIEYNLESISKLVIEFLKNSRFPVSAEDLKSSQEFKQVDGDLSMLLEKLAAMGIIKENARKYTTYGDEFLIDERVFYEVIFSK